MNLFKTTSLILFLSISLTTILSPSPTSAKKHHRSPVWTITNALPDEWQSAFDANLADFNANMPKYGPHFTVIRIAPEICQEANLKVCGGDGRWEDNDSSYWGISLSRGRKGRGINVNVMDIRIDTDSERRRILCHEFMHQLGYVSDNYNALPDTSCVWGSLDHLGPWDIDILNQEWKS